MCVAFAFFLYFGVMFFSSVRLFFFFVGATKFPRFIIDLNTIVIYQQYCYSEIIIFFGATVFLLFCSHKVSQAFSRLHNSAAAMPMIA